MIRRASFVCCSCRVSFKGSHYGGCPICKGPLICAGHNFKAPKKNNKKQWRLVERRLFSKISMRNDDRNLLFSGKMFNGDGYHRRSRQNKAKGPFRRLKRLTGYEKDRS